MRPTRTPAGGVLLWLGYAAADVGVMEPAAMVIGAVCRDQAGA